MARLCTVECASTALDRPGATQMLRSNFGATGLSPQYKKAGQHVRNHLQDFMLSFYDSAVLQRRTENEIMNYEFFI